MSGQGSPSAVVPDRLIVQIDPGFDIKKWVEQNAYDFKEVRPIFKKRNYWVIEMNVSQKSLGEAIKSISKTKGIQGVYQDYYTESRIFPNDPMISDQWPLGLIEVDKVWDITTGGTTYDGQEIVVAVIDDGYDILHEDLIENHWINTAEIEGNGIDDDNNGYVDDYFGLHVPSQSDNHLVINHGVSVAGIIGAKGNNGLGISGINWDVKLMLLSITRSVGNSGGSVSDIVEAYQYVLEQREKYNETDGEEGAFVVVTNYSGGISRLFPEDVPMWCDVYDELGQAGILNVSAVANEGYDADVEGDIPTLCVSDFLLTITNTDIADRKVNEAAFGRVSVDLGAPGEDAPSTRSNDRYAPFNGTSSAAPHAAGVAALIYSLPCSKIVDLAKTDPPAAALLVKQAMMDGVDLIPELNSVTVSEGRLNAYNAFVELEKSPPAFMNCPEDITISEEDSAYVWDEPEILDDCGGYTLISSFERGSEFRFGQTDVTLTVTDLLGNANSCSFSVTREGSAELEIAFLEVENVIYDPKTGVADIAFETGSFETHIIDIYNMIGQIVRRELFIPFNSGRNRAEIINLTLASGAYFVVVSKAGGGIRNAEKFVVAY